MSTRWKPSVTVAAVIEREHAGGSQFLLVEEHTRDGLRLNNPAGHLEPGESPQQAVVREALEETARVFVPEHIVGVYLARSPRTTDSEEGDDATYLRIAYGGRVGPADATLRLDEGIVGTVWLTLPELQASRPRHRSPLVLRCVEDAIAGRAYPLDLVACDPSVFAPSTGTASDL